MLKSEADTSVSLINVLRLQALNEGSTLSIDDTDDCVDTLAINYQITAGQDLVSALNSFTTIQGHMNSLNNYSSSAVDSRNTAFNAHTSASDALDDANAITDDDLAALNVCLNTATAA